jgi:hypothetical protein
MTYTPHDPLCAGRFDQCKCPALLQRKEDGRAKMLEILATVDAQLKEEPTLFYSEMVHVDAMREGVRVSAIALRELW